MGLFGLFKQKNNVEFVIQKYYRNYARKPFISPDRNFEKWEETISLFPNMLVQPEMMISYEDGLLPGHVYMLYWIENVHRSRIPDYFEYEYGISFEKEKLFLMDQGYLDENYKVTEKGHLAITDHYEVILRKNPAPIKTESISISGNDTPAARIIPERDSDSIEDIPEVDYGQLKIELQYLNRVCTDISEKYNLPKLTITFGSLQFGLGQFETHYVFSPFTKTKKLSKYPLSVRYSHRSPINANPSAFGDIYYLQDGKIGKTNQIYWPRNGKGYVISLGLTKGTLVLKKIELLSPADGMRTIVYKEKT